MHKLVWVLWGAGLVVMGVSVVWTTLGIAWLNNRRPKWMLWSNKVQEMADRGDFPDMEAYNIIADQITRDIKARNPLVWYRKWNKGYPMPPVDRSRRSLAGMEIKWPH